MVKTLERYVAALAYILDLGYFLSFLTKSDSEFIQFHFDQENKIIVRVLLPGIVLFFLGILWVTAASTILVYLGIIVMIVSLFLSLLGLISAIQGKKKRVI